LVINPKISVRPKYGAEMNLKLYSDT
jgi:hypothetical protein